MNSVLVLGQRDVKYKNRKATFLPAAPNISRVLCCEKPRHNHLLQCCCSAERVTIHSKLPPWLNWGEKAGRRIVGRIHSDLLCLQLSCKSLLLLGSLWFAFGFLCLGFFLI